MEASSWISKNDIIQVMRMYKVLFVSHEANLIGGAEKSLLDIVMYLKDKPDIEVTVATSYKGDLTKKLSLENIKVITIPYRWAIHHPHDSTKSLLKQSLASLGRIQKVLRQEKPDLIVTNTSVIPWFAYVARGLGIPHIWFIREHFGKHHGIPTYPDFDTTLKFIDAFSDKIMVNSQYMKEYYERILNRSDIGIVYPSINREILHYAPSANKRIKRKIRFIVYGGILPIKNQLEVIKAIRLLRKRFSEIELTIMGFIGDLDYYNKLISFVSKNNLTEFVKFLPHNKNPYRVVVDHDVCIIPSIHEPFGRVTVEAMLLKKAVIASDAGGNTEILKKSGHPDQVLYAPGNVKDLAKKMEYYIKNPEEIQKIGDSLQEYAIHQFTGERQIFDFYTAIKKFASHKKESVTDWISNMLTSQQRLYDSELRRLHNEIHKRDVLIQSIVGSKRWKYSSHVAKTATSFKRVVKKRR
jgi:glycosyltransferase involved in cell wall biosynthesis